MTQRSWIIFHKDGDVKRNKQGTYWTRIHSRNSWMSEVILWHVDFCLFLWQELICLNVGQVKDEHGCYVQSGHTLEESKDLLLIKCWKDSWRDCSRWEHCPDLHFGYQLKCYRKTTGRELMDRSPWKVSSSGVWCSSIDSWRWSHPWLRQNQMDERRPRVSNL